MKGIALWLALAATVLLCRADSLEEWIERSADPEDAREQVAALERNRLDLNRASRNEIAELPFFDEISAGKIVDCRARLGGIGTWSDLNGCGLDVDQRAVLRRLTRLDEVRFETGKSQLRLAAGKDISGSQWSGRARATFQSNERARGFIWTQHALQESKTVSAAQAGLEFTSGFEQTRIVLGDYQIESGTGLVFACANGGADWRSEPGSTGGRHSGGIVLRGSASRQFILRGAAVSTRVGPMALTAAGCISPRDAAVSEPDRALWREDQAASSTELIHARADQVQEQLLGGAVEWKSRRMTLGIGGYQSGYSRETEFASSAGVSASILSLGSAWGVFSRGGLTARAEAAASRPGGRAFQALLSHHADELSLVMYHVYADPDYCSPHGLTWSGNAANSSITGLRVTAAGETAQVTVDLESGHTPGATASSALPKRSSGISTRGVISPEGPWSISVTWGRTWNEDEGSDDPRAMADRFRFELEAAEPFTQRVRMELRTARSAGSDEHLRGTLAYYQVTLPVFNFRLNGRLTYFNLPDDRVVIQPYEPSLSGFFPLAALSGSGSRQTVFVSGRWRALGAAVKAAYTRRVSSAIYTHDFETGIELSCRL